MRKSEFAVAFDKICNERNLDKQVVLEAIEVAILTAYKKDHSPAQNVTVKLDPETGQAKIYTTKEVVEQVQDERYEISLDEAKRINEDTELGELVSVDRLSTGTRDLLYLMLRVAIARLMSRTGETLPLLLDDPLVQCDRARQDQTLAYLAQLAKETQVFLFTKDEWTKTWFEAYLQTDPHHNLYILSP